MRKIVTVSIQEYPNVTVVPAKATFLTVVELSHNEFVAYYEVEDFHAGDAFFIFRVEELHAGAYIPDGLEFVGIINSRRNLALYARVGD